MHTHNIKQLCTITDVVFTSQYMEQLLRTSLQKLLHEYVKHAYNVHKLHVFTS